MSRAQEIGGFYRIPVDDRDLNYSHYFTLGQVAISAAEDYTSHNTIRLNREEIVELLLKLDYIRQEIKNGTSQT
jgi:UDP-N-acetylglucosamine 4,6-dehydratase/5-epimerase